MKSGKKMLTLVAVITAIIGAAVAVGTFLKRNAKSIGEKLDYDGHLYYEDDVPDEYEAILGEEEEDLAEEEELAADTIVE